VTGRTYFLGFGRTEISTRLTGVRAAHAQQRQDTGGYIRRRNLPVAAAGSKSVATLPGKCNWSGRIVVDDPAS